MSTKKILLEPSWLQHLHQEFEKTYFKQLKNLLLQTKEQNITLYPKPVHWFKCFDITPLSQVKVVIIGQDPYHGPKQAHGLCFSVPNGVAIPPSLLNIYKELKSDLLWSNLPQTGNLESWGRQGVLLLNSSLTVEHQKAGSHSKWGWQTFTEQVIKVVSTQQKNSVFLLWGSHSQKKRDFIDEDRHLILCAPHPSPLSAHRGFLGCRHFSQANKYLQKHRQTHINWGSILK